MKTNFSLGASALGLMMGLAVAPAFGTVTYNTWSSNEAPNGNYVFTVTHDAVNDLFNYNITVNPWNAEVLGLFIDLGAANFTVPLPLTLTNVSPVGEVTLCGTDHLTSNNQMPGSCSNAADLGLNSGPAPLGNDWELVLQLGTTGLDSIQTFSWTTPDFGLTEAAFGVVGIRAQNLCNPGQLLPTGTCPGSDKVWGTGTISNGGGGGGGGGSVPEPGVLFLMGAGLLGLGMARRRKSA